MTDLDMLMRASAWLMEKYDLDSFPELMLSKGAIYHRCNDGQKYKLKGLYELDGRKITITDDEDAVLTLIHEVLHDVSHLKCTGALEAEVDARAKEDLKEFERYDNLRKIAKLIACNHPRI